MPPLIEESKPTVEHHYFIDHQAVAAKQLETLSSKQLDADWNFEEFFGTIFVINLPQEKERRERIEATLRALGVKEFEVFLAINGRKEVSESLWKKMYRNWANIDLSKPKGQKKFERQRKGETGCYLSHLGVIKKVKERFEAAKKEMSELLLTGGTPEAIEEAYKKLRKSSSVLILEDDNGFGIVSDDRFTASVKGVGRLFRKAMLELPQSWDMLYFMAMSREPEEPFSPHLVKLNRAILNNAYAVHYTFYNDAVAKLEQIYDSNVDRVETLDGALGELHRNSRSYAVTPSIAYQTDGTSSIVGITRKTYRQIQPEY